jgi:hypothetical protein
MEVHPSGADRPQRAVGRGRARARVEERAVDGDGTAQVGRHIRRRRATHTGPGVAGPALGAGAEHREGAAVRIEHGLDGHRLVGQRHWFVDPDVGDRWLANGPCCSQQQIEERRHRDEAVAAGTELGPVGGEVTGLELVLPHARCRAGVGDPVLPAEQRVHPAAVVGRS